MSKKRELIRKIRSLAERGVSCESDAAARALERMMKKYGLTDDDLAEDRREWREIRYSSAPFEGRLLRQVVYMLRGNTECRVYCHSKRKVKLFYLTASELSEIVTAFEFYRRLLAETMDAAYDAFVIAEHIFPDDTLEKSDSAKEPSKNAVMLAAMMDRHPLRPAITDGETKNPG